MFQRILVATDGSALSQKAVTSAIALAALNGATLVAFTVIPRYPASYLEGAAVFLPQDVARIEKQWADAAQETLIKISKEAQASGVNLTMATINSDQIGEAIVAAAIKHRSDLIVMASHGRKGIRRVLLGSETQYVLAHSELPVLVLR